MTEVVDRLVNSSSALQSAIVAAGANFAAVEHSLSDRMDDFRALLTNVTNEVDQFNKTAGASLGEASGLAETIARHRESLSVSAGELTRSQGELDQMLDARRHSLETLLQSIKDRRDDFENVMVSFAGLVEEIIPQRRNPRARYRLLAS